MPHFKNNNNDLFWLNDNVDAQQWLPDCVIITDNEAALIRTMQLQAEQDALTYAELRAFAYPSIADQLDKIYHEGIDAWKADIAAVKQSYPKP